MAVYLIGIYIMLFIQEIEDFTQMTSFKQYIMTTYFEINYTFNHLRIIFKKFNLYNLNQFIKFKIFFFHEIHNFFF